MAEVQFYRGLKAKYSLSTHIDSIYFATDTHEIVLNNVSYGLSATDLATLQSSINNSFNNISFTSPNIIKFTKGNGDITSITLPVATTTVSGLMSSDDKTKLISIESSAQTNVLEGVQVNSSDLPITNKKVNIDLSTPLSTKADKSTTYTKTEVDTKVNSAVSSVYKIKGSTTYAALPTTGNQVGDVYVITDAFTLDGKDYPAGTNIVCVNATNNTWSPLSGTFDSSQLESEIAANTTAINAEKTRAQGVESGLRTDLGVSTDTANASGSAYARIKDLISQLNNITGSNGTIDTKISTAITALINGADTDFDTLKEIETAIKNEIIRAKAAEASNTSSINTNTANISANTSAINTINGTGVGSFANGDANTLAQAKTYVLLQLTWYEGE